MDIAALGYQVDSSALDTATPKLEKMTAAALNADAAADKLAKNSTAVNTGVAKTGVAAAGATTQMNKYGGASANVFAQLNDIAVMMSAGQNPMQLAMQQGMQLNQVWAQLGGNIKSIGGVIGSALMSMLNPINLVTIGVIAFGSAAVNWFMASGDEAKKTKTAMEGLTDAVDSYIATSQSATVPTKALREEFGSMAFAARDALSALADVERKAAIDALNVSLMGLKTSLTAVTIIGSQNGKALSGLGLADDFGLAADQAQRLEGALLALDNAATLPEMSAAAIEVRDALDASRDTAGNLSGPLEAAYTEINKIVVEASKMQGEIENASFSIWDFVAGANSAANALAGAAGWAQTLAANAANAAAQIWSVMSAMAEQRVRAESYIENSTTIGAYQEYARGRNIGEEIKANTVLIEHQAKELEKAGKKGGGAGKKISDAQKKAEKALKDSAKAAEKLQEELDAPMIGAIDGVSNAWGDFVVGGFKDFKGFVDSVKDSFKSMISEMIAYSLKNKLMLAMGFSTTASAAGVAQASTSGGGGILSLLTGGGATGAAGGGGILGGLGGLLGGISGGASSVLSGLMSGGLGGVGSAVSTALGGISGGGLAGLGTAIGALGAVAAGIGAIASFFKTKKTILDSGFKLTTKGMKSLVDTFSTVEKKKFWGLSKSVSTGFERASKAISDPITNAVMRIQKSVLKNAAAIGVSEKVFAKFRKTIWFSTKDLSKDEISQMLQQRLTGLGNSFAKLVPGLMSMKRGGEGLMDTLARVALQFKVVNKTWRVLGFDLYDVSVKGAKAADAIVKIFGNVQNFIQSTAFYFDNFYTDQEKIAELQRRIGRGMRGAGVGGAIPTTIEQYRAMVDRLEAQGRDKAAAKLIKLAPLFIELQNALGGVTDEVNALKDALNPNDFATLFDYQMAGARLMSGAFAPNGPSIYSAPPSNVAASTSPAVTQSSGQSSAPSANGSENNDALLVQILQQIRSLRNINFKWDTEGMPDVREA